MQTEIIPRTFDALQNEATPRSVDGGNMEAVAWDIYDTATYVDATTTSLTFFTTTRNSPRLSNLSPAGQFPNPQFFRIYSASLDIMVPPGAAGTQAVVYQDMWRILFGSGTQGAPTFLFTLANKQYGPFPLSRLHGTGGPTGQGYSTGTTVGEVYANNSYPDGGYCFANSILIPPQQAFSVTLEWDGPQDLAADVRLRTTLHGTLYRRIL